MTIITRFAPSPTGLLHIGNVRTALINWIFSRKQNGKFILRIDDTDIQRSTTEYEKQIKSDLKWLGIDWDETFNQKDRLNRYEEITSELIKKGFLYPCYETKEELDFKRKIQLSQGTPPIYDRASLKLSEEQLNQYQKEGKNPHYRFKLSNTTVAWQDMVRGEMKFDGQISSDPILIREDGSWTYMLCSVIDDIDYHVTHVVRGEDHISNTVVAIEIFKALEKPHPTFAHVSRVTSKTKEMSKRTGGFDIKSLKEQNLESITLMNFLSTIGTSNATTKFTKISDIIQHFDIHSLSKSPCIYEESELWTLNHKILSTLDFEHIKSRISSDINEAFWLTIRENIHNLSEVETWYNLCYKPVTPTISEQDREFLTLTSSLLQKYNKFDEYTWNNWINEIKKHTDRKGKNLFLPIRLALTSLSDGPELKFILPLLTKEKTINRLLGNTA